MLPLHTRMSNERGGNEELNQPYNKEFDSIEGFDSLNIFKQRYANFNCDWKTELISEEGQGYFRVVEGLKRETADRNKRIQEEIRIQAEVQYEKERQAEQIKEITQVLLESMNNQTDMSYQPCSQPPVNNYVPHYTKPWTKSELAKVGAYSTKPSEAQKVYAQAAAKQDRAWAASLKKK